MKNIFKFLGIAVLACGMMVACGGNDPEENTDTTPVTPPAPQSSFTVNFDGQSWEAVQFLAVDHSDEGYVTVYGYKTNQGEQGIYVNGFLETTPGNYDYEGTGGDIINYRDPAVIFVDTDNFLGQGEGKAFWGYYTIPSSFAEVVTACDLNALTMSASWSANVIMLEDYATTGDMTQCTNYPLSGEMVNAAFTWTSK